MILPLMLSASPAQAAILRVIHDHRTKNLFVTQTRMMQLAGLRRREFEKNIDVLQKAGVISVETYKTIKIIVPIESIVVEYAQSFTEEDKEDALI